MNSSTGSSNGHGSDGQFQWPFQGSFAASCASFFKPVSNAIFSTFSNSTHGVPLPVARLIWQVSTQVLNHLLRQKPAAALHLVPHANLTFTFVLAFGTQKLRLSWMILPDGLLTQNTQDLDVDAKAPHNENVEVFETIQRSASNTTIHLNMTDVVQGLPKLDAIKRKVRIEGDVELAQSISTAMNLLEWDAEADLASILGDAPAVWIMQSLQWTQEQLQQKWQSIRDVLYEYWVYETRVMPNPHEYDVWRADVATLRDDVARLEKRMNVLESLRKAQSS